MSTTEGNHKLAVLIDAENVSYLSLEAVWDKIAEHGKIALKRAYGNWMKESLKNWKSTCLQLSIKAVQQFDYTTGKNATDMALTIDAMDLLYTGLYDAFVIVSGDSDYTPLALRLREANVLVIGVGTSQTGEALKIACDKFYTVDDKSDDASTSASAAEAHDATQKNKNDTGGNAVSVKPADKAKNTTNKKMLDKAHGLFKKAWENHKSADNFISVSTAGQYIKNADAKFNIKTTGHASLTKFLKYFPQLYTLRFTGNTPTHYAIK